MDTESILTLLLIFGLALGFGYWASTIAKRKGLSPGLFFAIGFFLGLIGIIIAAVVKPATPPAPPV